MSTALVRLAAPVRRIRFRALCGSLACQETAEHTHAECPDCGRPLVPGLASLTCELCRLAAYGGPSTVYVTLVSFTLGDYPACTEAEYRALLKAYGLTGSLSPTGASRALGAPVPTHPEEVRC